VARFARCYPVEMGRADPVCLIIWDARLDIRGHAAGSPIALEPGSVVAGIVGRGHMRNTW